MLDVLLQREPWLADDRALWRAVDDEHLRAFLPTSVLIDIFYVARRLTDSVRAWQAVQVCLDAFEIAGVDRCVLESAQVLAGADFEDNVQIAYAELNQLEAIVTRDLDDYAGSPIPVWSPGVCRRHLSGPREQG